MKIVVAVTGASGALYAQLLLSQLEKLQNQCEIVSVVFSKSGKEVWNYELNIPTASIPFSIYTPDDFFAPFASGSAGYDVMIVCPCTMGTLGRIANGIADDLIGRAADVILKERRKLILVTRETPLNMIHIANMETVTKAGGIICPASPSFYSKPTTIEALAQTVIDRVLDLSGFSIQTYRWNS